MKNILITGGAGFIGSNLALKLISKGYRITILDNLSPQIHGDNPEVTSDLYKSLDKSIRFIRGSVTSRVDWQNAIQDQDIIVHLAAETGTGQSMYCIEKYTNVNIQGTAILFDLLANNEHSIKKIIVASSRAIYGEGKYKHDVLGFIYPSQRSEEDMIKGEFEFRTQLGDYYSAVPTDESSTIHPNSVYGITKQNQEQIVMTVCKALGIAAVSLRYQNVYGPGQSLKNPYTGILSIFSTQIRNGNTIQIFEDGKESRDFVFIDDVVDATILAIEKSEANNEIFNVGTGVATTVLDVANFLVKFYQKQTKLIITGKFRIGDIRHNFADIKKIKSKLGFTPKISFEHGVKTFTEWVLTQEIAKDNLEESLSEMKRRGLYK